MTVMVVYMGTKLVGKIIYETLKKINIYYTSYH